MPTKSAPATAESKVEASPPESTPQVEDTQAAPQAEVTPPAAPVEETLPVQPGPVEDPAPAESEQAPTGPERISLVGFEVGRPAPTDAYQALHSDGGFTGPAYTTHPGGGAVQHCVAGTTVTDGVMRALTAADAPQEG